jgi:hypothetical protein
MCCFGSATRHSLREICRAVQKEKGDRAKNVGLIGVNPGASVAGKAAPLHASHHTLTRAFKEGTFGLLYTATTASSTTG